MSQTTTLLSEVKTTLEALAPTFRADQLERDANGALKAPPNVTEYFVIFFLVGNPQNTSQRSQRDTMRVTAWAQDSNAADKLQGDAEPLLEQLTSIRLGRLTYDGFSSPYQGWTREIFLHEGIA